MSTIAEPPEPITPPAPVAPPPPRPIITKLRVFIILSAGAHLGFLICWGVPAYVKHIAEVHSGARLFPSQNSKGALDVLAMGPSSLC